jgi:hypothetical protein
MERSNRIFRFLDRIPRRGLKLRGSGEGRSDISGWVKLEATNKFRLLFLHPLPLQLPPEPLPVVQPLLIL